MGRYLAAVVLVGGAVFLGGLFGARSVRQQAAIAQSHVPVAHTYQPVAAQPFSATTSHARALHDVSIASSDGPRPRTTTEDASVPEADSPASPNRFDRGRLNEEFDGAIFGSAPRETPEIADTEKLDAPTRTEVAENAAPLSLIEAAEHPAIPTPSLADDGPTILLAPSPLATDAGNPLAPPLDAAFQASLVEPNRKNTLEPRVPLIAHPSDEDGFQSAPDVVPPRSTVPTARVTLIRTPDHQIRIVAETQSAAETQQPLPTGAISITAEEFNLVAPTEPGTGNQLQCTGRIEMRGQHFTARCSRLSVKNNDLVLEGTVEQPAEIIKSATAVDDANGAKPDASEFRLSATKISFTLTLDKLQVGNGATILPVPLPPQDVKDSALPIEPVSLKPADIFDTFRIESSTPFVIPAGDQRALPTGTIVIGPATETKPAAPPK